MNKLEVCCGSYEDVLIADKAGAYRVELVSALSLGGLSPSYATVKKSVENTNIKIICMIRPRPCGFNYSKEEVEVMFMDAKAFLDLGVDGLAFGFLNSDKTIDIDLTKKMTELIHSYNKEAVFHRAFDLVEDRYSALDILCELGVDRILTSAGKKNCDLGKENLKKLNEYNNNRIEILMGSGINKNNIKELMQYTGINQAHSSAKGYSKDLTTSNEELSYGYLNEFDYEIVSFDEVKLLLEAIK